MKIIESKYILQYKISKYPSPYNNNWFGDFVDDNINIVIKVMDDKRKKYPESTYRIVKIETTETVLNFSEE